MLKIEREGEQTSFEVSDIMTRLTLDTIALCAFDYRFNSFYKEDMHPFVNAMVEVLLEANQKPSRPKIQDQLMFLNRRKNQANINYLNQIADDLIAARKSQPNKEINDLLNLMLNSEDPLTGEKLSDENIRRNLITFLIAGHETTSGMLSFTTYLLLENPEILAKAQAEVDRVLGNDLPTVKHISKLSYIDQILKESLRLYPTAPAYTVCAKEDTIIGGKYAVKKDQPIIILLPTLHRDKSVWGDDVEAFNPDRFLPENYEKLPPNSWKPFGNGQRSCIGRPFAMQEAILVLSMLLQRFDISYAKDYQLEIKETLTLKPYELYIKAKRRDNGPILSKNENNHSTEEKKKTISVPTENLTPLCILYGSNSGSSEGFAQKVGSDAKANGFNSTLGILDDYIDNLPKETPVLIITASYEGKPTENAKQFVKWLETEETKNMEGITYAVFGCGHRDWVRTYQAIPRLIDKKLAEFGGERILKRGEADARGDFFGDFEDWYDQFWPALREKYNKTSLNPTKQKLFEIEFITGQRTEILQQPDLKRGTIVENRELVNMSHPLGRSKRHIEISLPEGLHYKAGDYLAILPENPPLNIQRALKRFHLKGDEKIIIRKNTDTLTFLPTGFPITVKEVLANYVELAQPATRKQVKQMAEICPCPPEKIRLMAFAQEKKYLEAVLAKRLSVFGLIGAISCRGP